MFAVGDIKVSLTAPCGCPTADDQSTQSMEICRLFVRALSDLRKNDTGVAPDDRVRRRRRRRNRRTRNPRKRCCRRANPLPSWLGPAGPVRNDMRGSGRVQRRCASLPWPDWSAQTETGEPTGGRFEGQRSRTRFLRIESGSVRQLPLWHSIEGGAAAPASASMPASRASGPSAAASLWLLAGLRFGRGAEPREPCSTRQDRFAGQPCAFVHVTRQSP